MRWLILGMIALTVACGGGGNGGKPDRVLHLRTGDYTESRLLAEIRSEGISASECASFKGLSASEIRDIIDVTTPTDPVVQEASTDDELRYAELVIQECARVK